MRLVFFFIYLYQSLLEMCGTRTKRKTLTGLEPGPENNYRDHNRDRDQRLNPRLYDGLNSVNFCTSEVTLFEKKSPKVLVVD